VRHGRAFKVRTAGCEFRVRLDSAGEQEERRKGGEEKVGPTLRYTKGDTREPEKV